MVEIANTKCLKGWRCPKCSQTDRFLVKVRTWMELLDDGTGMHEDVQWTPRSACRCPACGFEGRVRQFLDQTREGKP